MACGVPAPTAGAAEVPATTPAPDSSAQAVAVAGPEPTAPASPEQTAGEAATSTPASVDPAAADPASSSPVQGAEIPAEPGSPSPQTRISREASEATPSPDFEAATDRVEPPIDPGPTVEGGTGRLDSGLNELSGTVEPVRDRTRSAVDGSSSSLLAATLQAAEPVGAPGGGSGLLPSPTLGGPPDLAAAIGNAATPPDSAVLAPPPGPDPDMDATTASDAVSKLAALAGPPEPSTDRISLSAPSSGPALDARPSPAPDPMNGPSSQPGIAGPSSNGFFLFGFVALLLSLLGLAAPAIGRRLRIAPACWRPVPFVSLLERPG
jgi:hypothetical protein